MEIVYILYEIVANSPTMVIPFGYILGGRGNIGSRNFETKLNLQLFAVFGFLLLLAPFLILVGKFSRKKRKNKKKEETVIQKKAVNQEKAKLSQRKTFFKTFDTSRSDQTFFNQKVKSKASQKMISERTKEERKKLAFKKKKKMYKLDKKINLGKISLV